MLRFVVILLVSIFLITFIRMVIGLIVKAFGDLLASETQSEQKKTAGVKQGGELKKDPVCGTYIAAETSVKASVGGQVLHFCSAACRDKYMHPQ